MSLHKSGIQDTEMMRKALQQAAWAAERGEVPVGAVLVDLQGMILAAAGNACVSTHDPSGHAEILVLRQAAARIGNYRLVETTLFVTLEPCPMCAAALVHARVRRVVFGAADPKAGALGSVYRIGCDGLLNHHLDVTGGVLAGECSRLLRKFFRERRGKAEKILDKIDTAE